MYGSATMVAHNCACPLAPMPVNVYILYSCDYADTIIAGADPSLLMVVNNFRQHMLDPSRKQADTKSKATSKKDKFESNDRQVVIDESTIDVKFENPVAETDSADDDDDDGGGGGGEVEPEPKPEHSGWATPPKVCPHRGGEDGKHLEPEHLEPEPEPEPEPEETEME